MERLAWYVGWREQRKMVYRIGGRRQRRIINDRNERQKPSSNLTELDYWRTSTIFDMLQFKLLESNTPLVNWRFP